MCLSGPTRTRAAGTRYEGVEATPNRMAQQHPQPYAKGPRTMELECLTVSRGVKSLKGHGAGLPCHHPMPFMHHKHRRGHIYWAQCPKPKMLAHFLGRDIKL